MYLSEITQSESKDDFLRPVAIKTIQQLFQLMQNKDIKAVAKGYSIWFMDIPAVE